MSFQRVPGPGRRKKVPIRKKPQWDDSVNDLTVYKASPDEIMSRKEAHKSKNHISVKLEQMRKENRKSKRSGSEAQQLAIMKEILYDQEQLQNVISKSDKMLAVVKDLFGDDPKRFTGFPNVTSAPYTESDKDRSSSLIASVPDIYTRTEKLSDSVMNQSALNDVDTTDSDEDDDDDEVNRPGHISYESALNLQRFQQYIQEEENRSDHLDPPTLVALHNKAHFSQSGGGGGRGGGGGGQTGHSNQDNQTEQPKLQLDPSQLVQLMSSLLSQAKSGDGDTKMDEQMQKLNLLTAALSGQDPSFQTPPRNQQGSPPLQNPPMQCTAINNTDKIRRTKKKPSPAKAANTSENVCMNDMRKVLYDLESEIAAYEHQTGRSSQTQAGKTETFSGYTVALVSAVSRLTRYLKETDLRVRTEVTLREQLTQDVYQLRAIIDALATDIIMTQEEYAKLYAENQRYRENTASQITSLQTQMLELRQHLLNQSPRTIASNMKKLQHHQQEETVPVELQQRNGQKLNASQKSGESKTSTPVDHHQDSSPKFSQSSSRPLPTGPQQSSATVAAVMLSPPVRKTRVASDVRTTIDASKRQESLVDISHLATAGSKQSADPPRLTQALPVINKVSVPKPIPLVQSNVSVALTEAHEGNGNTNALTNGHDNKSPVQANDLNDLVRLEDQTQEQLHQLQEMAVEEALKNPQLQDLMQTQIAELNRQQEEARKRLKNLLANQKVQQQHLQQQLRPGVALEGTFSPEEVREHFLGQTVSPPISPISQNSERPLLQKLTAGPGREITVSLPMVDLEVSSGSL